MNGFVSLVGAGPGDPELLTLRAVDRLQRADLILVDALVPDAVLAHAPATAQRFYVGKRAGRHSIAQSEIHKLLILGAQRGQRVVRLKCGDPFVLGRGGEEALALEEASIPYEVVPGLSSALAAPALANIPVTHRGVSTGFVVLSGHAADSYAPTLSLLAPGITLVILMGVRARAAITALLLERAWSPTTPAALVADASHPTQAIWTGPLSALPDATLPADSSAVLVIGDVVALASQIRAQPQATTAAAI